MAKNNNLTDFLTGIANAIRAKKSTSALINPQDFEEEIAGISVGIKDVFTATELTALLTESNVGMVYRFTGTTDSTYTNGDLYEVITIGASTIKFLHYTVDSPLSIAYYLTNCTADSTNPTEIVKGKTYDFSFTADSGYEFPSSGTTSVSGGTIVALDYPDASDLTKITVAIEVTGNLTITQIASVALPQLATPQNVSANGTTVSWDEVENATSYEVRADGTSIGTVENESGETWLLNETIDVAYQGYGTTERNFISNSEEFTSIDFDGKPNGIRYNDTLAYSWVTNSWTNTAYRTITFAEPVTDNHLLEFLQANATKQ